MQGEEYISILHEPSASEPYIIALKQRGIPTAPLFEGDFSAYTFVERLFPCVKNVVGKKNVEHGLIHRLDTATEGLFMVAASQEFFDYMQNAQAEGRFVKTYTAQCQSVPVPAMQGFPPLPKECSIIPGAKNIVIGSYFRRFAKKGKEVRPVLSLENTKKLRNCSDVCYYTEVCSLSPTLGTSDRFDTVCKITRGFRHQIRCHLAWCGYPIAGDEVYNPKCSKGSDFLFFAKSLEFPLFDTNCIKKYTY